MEPQAITFLMAMLPISELRGALPLALTVFKLNSLEAFFLSVAGNIFIVPLIFVFLRLFQTNFFNNFSLWRKITEKIFLKFQGKNRSKDIKSLIGLALFVAVPLPITGAWTASIIAFFVGIPLKLALFAISSGLLISGLIIFFLTKTGIFIEQNFGWQMLFFFLLVVSLALVFFNKKVKNSGI